MLIESETVGIAQLRGAVSFMRAAHWMARVLDPRRPPLPEIREVAAAVKSANSESDPEAAARLLRPRSHLAARLAEHMTTVVGSLSGADALAASIHVAPGAPLRECVLGVSAAAGAMPMHAWPNWNVMVARARLARHAGGEHRGYELLRTILDAAVTDVDPDDTERKLLATRQRALEVVRSARAA